VMILDGVCTIDFTSSIILILAYLFHNNMNPINFDIIAVARPIRTKSDVAKLDGEVFSSGVPCSLFPAI
jgi:hypothetical protein